MKMLMMSFLIAGSYLMTGCSPNVTEHPLADGFFIRTTTPMLENSGGTRKLYYQSPSGTQKLVLKYVDDPVLVHSGTAVFIGSWEDTYKDEAYAYFDSGYAYFATKENGSVVRIAKAVLTRAAQKNGAQPEEYFKRYCTDTLATKGNVVQFRFSCRIGTDNPYLLVDLTWDEISEMVGTLTKTGKPHKDKLNGITYLE